ncbi:hypothetical protein G7046_g897 [Stylonectria norvegica]|nr:hypothetical protein G7046_g897 [Stylonectria norvegica]
MGALSCSRGYRTAASPIQLASILDGSSPVEPRDPLIEEIMDPSSMLDAVTDSRGHGHDLKRAPLEAIGETATDQGPGRTKPSFGLLGRNLLPRTMAQRPQAALGYVEFEPGVGT